MTSPPPLAIHAARARWRAAEDRLYPALMADPTSYQRTIAAVQAVVGELRRRATDVFDLMAADGAPDELVAAACPNGPPVSGDLLVAVACAMRDRELTVERAARRRDEVVRAARAADQPWAVLDGPADATDLTEGRRIALHLASGTVVEATVDPWSRDEPFGLTVLPGEPQAFADRDAWLAELARVESAIQGPVDAAP